MSNKSNWMWAYWCCKKGDNNPVTMLHEVKPLTTKYGCICATLYCVSIKLTAYWNFSLPFTSRPAYSSRSLFANQSELEIIYLFAMFTFGLLPICISDTIIYGFCRHVFHGASQHPCNPCNNVPLLLKETKQMSYRQTSNFFFFLVIERAGSKFQLFYVFLTTVISGLLHQRAGANILSAFWVFLPQLPLA